MYLITHYVNCNHLVKIMVSTRFLCCKVISFPFVQIDNVFFIYHYPLQRAIDCKGLSIIQPVKMWSVVHFRNDGECTFIIMVNQEGGEGKRDKVYDRESSNNRLLERKDTGEWQAQESCDVVILVTCSCQVVSVLQSVPMATSNSWSSCMWKQIFCFCLYDK